jgi:nucleoside-diphosphate-sugar epimerase
MITFITGGTSSIGRVLIKEIANRGERARVLVRSTSDLKGLNFPGIEFIYGDVTDPHSVRRGMEGCTKVTHMAAVVGDQVPEETWWRVNRDGTHNVLKTALEMGIQSYVQVSSISVLGPTASGEIADESRPIDTSAYFSLYQKTKHAADELVREYAQRSLNTKIVYPCFGYGCSHASSHPSLQDQTLLRLAAGKPAAVPGKGTYYLCLSYYKDTARGIQQAHEHGQSGEDYILGGENVTFEEIWSIVANTLGKSPPRFHIPISLIRFVMASSKLIIGRSILPPEFFEMISQNWRFSSGKAEGELGYHFHTFEEGIAETWAEYQARGYVVR